MPSSVIRHLEIKKAIEKKWTVLLLKELLKEYVVACEKAKTDSDKAFCQKIRFGVRPEHTYRSENSIQQSKQGPHRQSYEALAAQGKKRVHREQTQKELLADIVTVITGVMSAKNLHLLMTEKSN